MERVIERQQVTGGALCARSPLHLGLGIAQQLGSERHEVVDVLVAIYVVQPRALTSLELRRRRFEIYQRAPGQMDSARNDTPRAFVKRARTRVARAKLQDA